MRSNEKCVCVLGDNDHAHHITQMNEHLKNSEAELNELLAEYWKLRHETGIVPRIWHPNVLKTSTDVYMETLANKLNMRVTSD